MKALLFFALVYVNCFVSASGQIWNHDGRIDKSFGTNGYYVVQAPAGRRYASGDVTVSSDGTILIMNSIVETPSTIEMYRLLADGQVDTSFGTDGKVIYAVQGETFQGFSVANQPDGKILVGGTASFWSNGALQIDFLCLRFSHNGQIDTTFANNGIFKKDLAMPNEFSYDTGLAVLSRSDGRIILSGISDHYTVSGRTRKMLSIIGLDANGNPDPKFTDISVPIGDGDTGAGESPDSFKVTSKADGKILIAAASRRYISADSNQFKTFATLIRIRPDGTLDPGFAEDGMLDFEIPFENVYGLSILSDDKVLSITESNSIQEFNSDGTVAEAFGSGGKLIFTEDFYPWNIVVDAAGKLVILGYRQFNIGSGWQTVAAIRRIWSNGLLDIKFPNQGTASVGLPLDTYRLRNAKLLADKKLLLIGGCQINSAPALVIARIYGARKP